MEVWRDVVNYIGSYRVSINGEIYSEFKKRLLKPFVSSTGHLATELKGKHFKVHDIVAMAFPEICGEWFKGCIVHHIDRNRTNNNAYNLIVLTRGEHTRIHNLEDGKNPFYGKRLTGAYNYNAKAVIQYTKSGEFVKEWDCAKNASITLGINNTSIASCCTGKLKSAGGYIWKHKRED